MIGICTDAEHMGKLWVRGYVLIEVLCVRMGCGILAIVLGWEICTYGAGGGNRAGMGGVLMGSGICTNRPGGGNSAGELDWMCTFGKR